MCDDSGMASATMAPVGRTPSKLSSAYRTRLRRVHRRAALADAELRQLVLDGLADKEPLTAIARELGLTKQVLWARVEVWRKADRDHRTASQNEPGEGP